MGSYQDWVTCPKCKEEGVYARDYYYRSGEEFCTCMHCGYTHNYFMKTDENRKLERKMAKRYDLKKGNILYAYTEKNEDGKRVILKSTPVLPSDTVDDLYFFMNLHLCFYPFNKKELPEKFKMFSYDKSDEISLNGMYDIYYQDESGIAKLWFIGYDFKITDDFLEVSEPVWEVEEYGGFGVFTTQNESLISSYILKEGEVPEITEDIVFATAVIDGKLTVLKDSCENYEEPDKSEK